MKLFIIIVCLMSINVFARAIGFSGNAELINDEHVLKMNILVSEKYPTRFDMKLTIVKNNNQSTAKECIFKVRVMRAPQPTRHIDGAVITYPNSCQDYESLGFGTEKWKPVITFQAVQGQLVGKLKLRHMSVELPLKDIKLITK